MRRLMYVMVMLMAISLSGCGHKVEMSQIGIVAGLGIDQTENGYLMTAQVVNPSSIAGNQHDTLSVFSISGEGETLFDAYRSLNSLTAKVLYLPHLSVIVVNEDIAQSGIDPVVDFVLRNVMIRPNITLVVANHTTAREVLNVLTPSEQIPINQLNSLSNLCLTCTGREVNYNLYQVSGMVNDPSSNIVLNSVSIDSKEKSEEGDIQNVLQMEAPSQLKIDSLAAFQGDQLVGYLTSKEAQYYNLLVGTSKRYVVTTVLDDEYKLSYEVREAKVDVKPNLETNKVTVGCEVKGILMENGYPIDLMNPVNVSDLEAALGNQLKQDIQSFIDKTQNELASDIIGVGGKVHQKNPKKWAEVSGYWEDIYPELEFDVKVKLEITSVGDAANLKE